MPHLRVPAVRAPREVGVYLRALGWVWSDAKLEEALRRAIGAGKDHAGHIAEEKPWWTVQEVRREFM